MTDTVIQARTTLQPGVSTFGPVAIPADAVSFGFVIDKAIWSGTQVRVKGDAQLALDGVNMFSVGGFIDEPIGGPALIDMHSTGPLGAGKTGQLVLAITGGPISTIITLRTLIAGEGRVLP